MNTGHRNQPSRLTLPNLLSGFRLIAAPFLLHLAWYGHNVAFLWLLAVTFLTDALDGLVARMTGQVTQFGAQLDSWGDMVTYLTVAMGSWWLWPDIVQRESVYVALVVCSYLLPVAVGMSKFGRFTSYHTWSVKFAAVSMALTLYVLFLGGPAWPFRVAAVICLLAAIEEIAITVMLSEMQSNVGSILDVLRSSVNREQADEKRDGRQ